MNDTASDSFLFTCPCGKIQGQDLNGLCFFRGIPYAAAKRFTLPEIVTQWDGVFDATQTETDCWQLNSFCDESATFYCREFRAGRTFTYAESPMTLNIVTPSAVGRRPVLIFFHGGSFETGTVGELPYGSCVEYGKRDIVFVSVGYRLNIFGLYGGTNYGLADMTAAVDWVRNNIASFGGDPDAIVVMGQSAGAMSLMDLLCSEALLGKIRGAVMMSGAGIIPSFAQPMTRAESKRFWKRIASAIPGDIYTAAPETLWKAWHAAKAGDNLISGFRHMQPCIDGTIPPDTQKKRVRSGKILDVPIMIGVTSQDMLPVLLYEMGLQLGLMCEKNGHKPVYGYFFDRTLPGNSFKAFHASDLWYMFGNMDKSWRPFERIDYELSSEMIDSVAAFCRTGEPGNAAWTPISRKNKGFRHFDGISQGMVFPAFCRKKVLHSMLKDPGPA